MGAALGNIIEREARQLAGIYAQDDSIRQIWFFPDSEQIRLLGVDELALSWRDGKMHPFLFPPPHHLGVEHWIGWAMVNPSEKTQLSPPEGWGPWGSATLLFERG